jgi:hypothetical protein
LFAVAPNGGAAREGKVVIGGQSAAVVQAARAACPRSVTPSSQSIPASGGSFKFAVTADADCTWAPKPSADWIAIETGQGTGSTSGAYFVRPNAGAQRSATIQIGAQSIAVSQACDLALPSFAELSAAGGTWTLRVRDGCSWSLTRSPDWIKFSRTSGTGPVDAQVAPNTSGTGRGDAVVLNDHTIKVSQPSQSTLR